MGRWLKKDHTAPTFSKTGEIHGECGGSNRRGKEKKAAVVRGRTRNRENWWEGKREERPRLLGRGGGWKLCMGGGGGGWGANSPPQTDASTSCRKKREKEKKKNPGASAQKEKGLPRETRKTLPSPAGGGGGKKKTVYMHVLTSVIIPLRGDRCLHGRGKDLQGRGFASHMCTRGGKEKENSFSRPGQSPVRQRSCVILIGGEEKKEVYYFKQKRAAVPTAKSRLLGRGKKKARSYKNLRKKAAVRSRGRGKKVLRYVWLRKGSYSNKKKKGYRIPRRKYFLVKKEGKGSCSQKLEKK